MAYKILAINPGSTSTKISVAHDIEPLFVEDVKHLRSDLEHFHTIFDQYEYRKQHILQELERRNIPLDFDAVVGRGGLAKPVESGVYRVTPEMIEDQRTAPHQHPCDLGCKLAYEIAEMIVDKSDLDYLYLKAEIMIVDNKAAEADDFLQSQYDEVISQEDREDYVLDVAALFSDYEENEYVEKWLSRSTKTEDNDYKELRARLLKSRGKYKESESILNELLDTNPYSGPYWNQLAQNQLLRNDIKDSITSSEYSIAINPDDEEAILNKANGLFTLGNYEESLKYYERYKKLCHNQDTTVVDVTIGHIHLMQGNASEAQRYYHLALAETQSKSLTLIHIGISTFDNGYVEYAYNIFSTLLPEMDDDWDIGFAYLARCCYELKLKKEFNIYLRQAVERNPEESIEVLSDLYPEGTSPQDYPNIRIL